MDGQIQPVVSAQRGGIVRVHDFPFRGERRDMGGHIVAGGKLNDKENQNRNQKQCRDEHQKPLYDILDQILFKKILHGLRQGFLRDVVMHVFGFIRICFH